MKSYFRYSPSGRLGVICAPDGPTIFDQTGKLAFTSSVEAVGVWNLRQASNVCSLNYDDSGYPYSERSDVTSLSLTADHTTVCVGYSTGEVRLFNYVDKSVLTTLKGHRSAVSSLALKTVDNTVLASGSADCTIVLWDLVSRTGMTRLHGHKDMVTALSFVQKSNQSEPWLVSASKDTLLKVWDVVSMSCLQTIVGHRSEIWSMAIVPSEDDKLIRVFTGASDDLVRVYSMAPDSSEGAVTEDSNILQYYGCFKRSSNDRCVTMALNPSKTILAVQAAGKVVDFVRLLDAQQVKRRSKRRSKRAAEKADAPAEPTAEEDAEPVAIRLEDEIEYLQALKVGSKIRSFAFNPQPPIAGEDSALVSLANNALEMYKIQVPAANAGSTPVATKTSIIDLQGHRSDVRGLCVSGDDSTLATCSAETIKIWSTRSGQCISTCRTDEYALCLAFAPGGRFLLVGTKSGSLLVMDVANGEAVQSVEDAHEGAIWSICLRPDNLGFCTASADKAVKLWTFEIASEGGLRVSCDRQLVTPSDILCVRCSHSKGTDLLVATAQLDHNIRVFFHDSLKLYLTLYGHKLPVLSMDISSDNTLLVSGSADKTVKIWGLDFGDCHKSLFAHDDSVTCVRFVNRTHFFFTCGKDGAVKYWDADRFDQILYLPGHRGSVWSLEVAGDGSSAFSVGADRSVRLWSRQEDLVFIEEEKERMLEAQVDKAAAQTALEETQTAAAAIVSMDSIRSGDQLMACLDMIDQEVPGALAALLHGTQDGCVEAAVALHQVSKSAVMLSLSPLRYLLRSLRMVKAPDLEPALLALPFHYVQRLLVLLVHLARSGLEVELSCRCAVFLLMCHQNQVATSTALTPYVLSLRDVVVSALGSYRFLVGVNMAGLVFMQNQLAEEIQDAEAQKVLFRGKEDGGNRKRKAPQGASKS